MMENKIKFHYSKMVKILTVVATVLIVGGAIWMLSAAQREGAWLLIIAAVFMLVIFVGALLFAPLYYYRDEAGLHLRILMKTIHYTRDKYEINYDDLIEPMEYLRLFGSGGLFGYTGYFRTKGKKTCIFFLTNERKPVMSATNRSTGRTTYISK